ncbi:hypothetical protein QC763_0016180 [Podospora pseudopauciseta]|uniref:Uncharacterized protein n=1 Tax=Podospora pseudopauciseta TaxID=2093780 RepID=A0ABR0HZW9_9PEZI|nr:hypothetical protein QC763_0016180 [Podospora pseudopauciseta]
MSACFSLGLGLDVAISGAVEIFQEYHHHKKLNFWTGIDLKTHAKLQTLGPDSNSGSSKNSNTFESAKHSAKELAQAEEHSKHAPSKRR